MFAIAVAFLSLLSPTASAAETVPVQFWVTVPPTTPADATGYLAGNGPALGNWRADGVPLARHKDGRFHATINLPTNKLLEFKVTMGTWATVEKNEAGRDIANRKLTVTSASKEELTVVRWASEKPKQPDPPTVSTLTGDIRFHHEFKSRHLNNARTVAVYLPPGYEKKQNARFPVLYMHDGQNIFDAATSFLGIEWEADEHAERLITAGRIKPIIIVGIYNNAQRTDEYTPDFDDSSQTGGKGNLYAKFLVEEVKPFIDKTYRTQPERENSAIAGSSLGGLLSLHISGTHPKTFSMCGVISPALMWNRGSILKDLEESSARLKHTRFWLDMGTEEGRQIEGFNAGIDNTRRLVQIFDEAGLVPGRNYYYQEVFKGEHNEAHWAKRFDKVLLYFFGK